MLGDGRSSKSKAYRSNAYTNWSHLIDDKLYQQISQMYLRIRESADIEKFLNQSGFISCIPDRFRNSLKFDRFC